MPLINRLACAVFVVAAIATPGPTPASAQQIRRIQVVDRDTRKGVPSDIELIDPKSAASRVGPTDASGYFDLKVRCGAGSRLRASPQSRQYFSGLLECPPVTSVLPVQNIGYIRTLRANADLLEKRDHNAEAALIYNELLKRLEVADAKQATQAQEKTYALFGKTLGHDEPTRYDRLQGKLVITPEFKQAIEEFQKSKGLPATGVLDYATLEAAAEKPISVYLFERVQEVGTPSDIRRR